MPQCSQICISCPLNPGSSVSSLSFSVSTKVSICKQANGIKLVLGQRGKAGESRESCFPEGCTFLPGRVPLPAVAAPFMLCWQRQAWHKESLPPAGAWLCLCQCHPAFPPLHLPGTGTTCSFCTSSACCWCFSTVWNYLLTKNLSTKFCSGCRKRGSCPSWSWHRVDAW